MGGADDSLLSWTMGMTDLDAYKIPTLTEWGMIIFCVLLFGWMAWVIVRRRKALKVRI
jgi:hypothetical protein